MAKEQEEYEDDMDDKPAKKSKGGKQESKRMLCGLLGILVGWTGAHKFVLGQTVPGVITLIVSIVTCGLGGIIGLIEGIIYLTKSDEDFIQTYQVEKKAWF
jgi:TM2 domain-containing membrane protein YozV